MKVYSHYVGVGIIAVTLAMSPHLVLCVGFTAVGFSVTMRTLKFLGKNTAY